MDKTFASTHTVYYHSYFLDRISLQPYLNSLIVTRQLTSSIETHVAYIRIGVVFPPLPPWTRLPLTVISIMEQFCK